MEQSEGVASNFNPPLTTTSTTTTSAVIQPQASHADILNSSGGLMLIHNSEGSFSLQSAQTLTKDTLQILTEQDHLSSVRNEQLQSGDHYFADGGIQDDDFDEFQPPPPQNQADSENPNQAAHDQSMLQSSTALEVSNQQPMLDLNPHIPIENNQQQILQTRAEVLDCSNQKSAKQDERNSKEKLRAYRRTISRDGSKDRQQRSSRERKRGNSNERYNQFQRGRQRNYQSHHCQCHECQRLAHSHHNINNNNNYQRQYRDLDHQRRDQYQQNYYHNDNHNHHYHHYQNHHNNNRHWSPQNQRKACSRSCSHERNRNPRHQCQVNYQNPYYDRYDERERNKTLQIIVQRPIEKERQRENQDVEIKKVTDDHRNHKPHQGGQYRQRSRSREVRRFYFENDNPENPGNNVYVAGIPRRVTSEELRRIFGKFGPLIDAKVIKDPQTNQSKGFAYVLFERVNDATAAIQALDNTRQFNDWQLKVERAKRAIPYECKSKEQLLSQEKSQEQKAIIQQNINLREKQIDARVRKFSMERQREHQRYPSRSRSIDYDRQRRDHGRRNEVNQRNFKR